MRFLATFLSYSRLEGSWIEEVDFKFNLKDLISLCLKELKKKTPVIVLSGWSKIKMEQKGKLASWSSSLRLEETSENFLSTWRSSERRFDSRVQIELTLWTGSKNLTSLLEFAVVSVLDSSTRTCSSCQLNLKHWWSSHLSPSLARDQDRFVHYKVAACVWSGSLFSYWIIRKNKN